MSYVNIETRGEGDDQFLRMTVTAEGKAELQARVDDGESIDADQCLHDLLEDHTSNGWDWVRPEEIGALTDAPIISDNVERDDHGDITTVASVYAFMDYQVRSVASDLLNYGYADWVYAAMEKVTG
jgi:hypothetical protein